MPRPHIETIANLSDQQTKRRLYTTIATLREVYAIEFKPVNPQRSSQQNRYFHGVVVQALYEYLNDPGHGTGKRFSREQCKTMIVVRALGTDEVIHPTTGELITEAPRSTSKLSIDEFIEFIDNSIVWLSESFGIEVPPPQQVFADYSAARKQTAEAGKGQR